MGILPAVSPSVASAKEEASGEGWVLPMWLGARPRARRSSVAKPSAVAKAMADKMEDRPSGGPATFSCMSPPQADLCSEKPWMTDVPHPSVFAAYGCHAESAGRTGRVRSSSKGICDSARIHASIIVAAWHSRVTRHFSARQMASSRTKSSSGVPVTMQ